MSTAVKRKYAWIKQYQSEDGHSFWKDDITGMIAIKDRSGPTPDTTDDGVLWLENNDWVMDGKYIQIPVRTDDWKVSYCFQTYESGIKCAIELGYPIRVERGEAERLPLSIASLLVSKAKATTFKF